MGEKSLPKTPTVKIATERTSMRMSAEAKEMLIKSAEIFVGNLAEDATQHPFFGNKKTIQKQDIEYVLEKKLKKVIPDLKDVQDEE